MQVISKQEWSSPCAYSNLAGIDLNNKFIVMGMELSHDSWQVPKLFTRNKKSESSGLWMGTPYSQGDNFKLVRHIISRLLVRVCFEKLTTSEDSRTTLVKFIGVQYFWENTSVNDNWARNMSKDSIFHLVIKGKLGYLASCQQTNSNHKLQLQHNWRSLPL